MLDSYQILLSHLNAVPIAHPEVLVDGDPQTVPQIELEHFLNKLTWLLDLASMVESPRVSALSIFNQNLINLLLNNNQLVY